MPFKWRVEKSFGRRDHFLCFGCFEKPNECVAVDIICLFCYCSNQLWSLWWCSAYSTHRYGATEMGITSLVAVFPFLFINILVFILIVDPFPIPFNSMQINCISSLFQELYRLSHPIELYGMVFGVWFISKSSTMIECCGKSSFFVCDLWWMDLCRQKTDKNVRTETFLPNLFMQFFRCVISHPESIRIFFCICAKYDNHRLIEPTPTCRMNDRCTNGWNNNDDTHIASHSL